MVLIAAVIAGVCIWVATAPSGSSAATSTVGPANGGSGGAGPSPVSSASTSTRGVTAHTINVVFPVVSLNSLAGQEGFAEDAEYGEQQKAIDLYVKQINDDGGINGRKINPIITPFDPDQRGGHAGAVQDLDRRVAGRVRRARRDRGVDR